MKVQNIDDTIALKIKDKELTKILASGKNVRLEEIVSPASNTPSQVYDQEESEFVMVIKGYAELEFEEKGRKTTRGLAEGDYINIPPHLRHRVIKTEAGTQWLALFYRK